MILWKSKVTTEDKIEFAHVGRRSWRWVFDMSFTSIDWREEVKFDDLDDRDWRHASRYLNVTVTRHFKLGGQHLYYDGPHCSFSIGFIHFNWSWNWCKKCMPNDKC